MFTVYGDTQSGNCYKVQLALHQLRLPYRWVAIDTLKKESRTAEFLARNPNGKIPVLELPTGDYLPESNAILHYLAEGSPLLPNDRLARARVLQWLFFEQYSHEPYIAVARYIVRYLGRPDQLTNRLQEKMAPGHAALGVMEQRLSRHDFLVDEGYSIADIALYAYTHVAHEGDFDLAPYPGIRAWLARVAEQPDYLPMSQQPPAQYQ